MLAIVSINSCPLPKHQFNVKRLSEDGSVRQYYIVRQTENVYIMPDAQVYEFLSTR